MSTPEVFPPSSINTRSIGLVTWQPGTSCDGASLVGRGSVEEVVVVVVVGDFVVVGSAVWKMFTS